MLILPQYVEICWNNRNREWYESKGYIWTKNREKFQVYVLDLLDGCDKKIDVLCDYCGRCVPKRLLDYNISKNKRNNIDCCKMCKGIKIGKTKTIYAIDSIRNEFNNRGLTLLEDEYLGHSELHKFICKNGHEDSTNIKNLLRSKGCKKCPNLDRLNRFKIEYVKEIFHKEGCCLLSLEYMGIHDKLSYICSCGTPDIKTLNHFKRGQRCKLCTKKIRRELRLLKYEYVKNVFEYSGCILLSQQFMGINIDLDFLCSCGRKDKYKFSPKTRDKIICSVCTLEQKSGVNHWNYNCDLTDQERENKRCIDGYYGWRISVFNRDSFTCQCCGDKSSGNLNAHHLDGYHWCKERRLDISNAVTLCENCHVLDIDSFHRTYGMKNNTEEQFWEWIENKIYKHIEDNFEVSSFFISKN